MFKFLLTKGLSFLAPFKMYLYLALLVAGVSYHFYYGHSKYVEGQQDQIQASAKAQIEHERKQHETEIKALNEALVRGVKESEHIKSLEKERDEAVNKARQLAIKATRPTQCDLVEPEWMLFNEAVRKANGT